MFVSISSFCLVHNGVGNYGNGGSGKMRKKGKQDGKEILILHQSAGKFYCMGNASTHQHSS